MKGVRNGRGKDNGKIRKNMEGRVRSVYSSRRSEIIVNLNEMRCSWSNAPQPITSTASDMGWSRGSGSLYNNHLDAIFMLDRNRMSLSFGFFVWASYGFAMFHRVRGRILFRFPRNP